MASSKPNQRSAKNMCPDISPASTAFSSFIFALMSEWPTFHMMARAAGAAISSYSAWLHFTSLTKVAPGCFVRMSRANRIISWSPQTMRPWPSTAPMRSASPSSAMPTSAPRRRTRAIRSARFSGTVGSGWWLGKRPSGSQ